MSNPTIEIRVNDRPLNVPHGCHLSRLLELMEIRTPAVAVEVNRILVPREQFATELAEGDRVEIVKLVGGG